MNDLATIIVANIEVGPSPKTGNCPVEPIHAWSNKHMPAYFHLAFTGPAPVRPGDIADYRHVNGLRAVIYDCLARVGPEFAGEMHADTWPKPLAISPLWWRGNGWELDVAVLLDGMGQMLLQGLAEHGPELRLGREAYHLRDVRIGESANIDEVMHLSGSVSQLVVDFLTPTTHHDTLVRDPILQRKTKIGYPLPDPVRTVTSWFHKWNCLMGRIGVTPIPDAFLEGLPYLALARMHGETQDIRLGDRQRLIGFCGSAVFGLLAPERVPTQFTSTLRLLAVFANYCGTGVETLRGMGQTRVRIRP